MTLNEQTFYISKKKLNKQWFEKNSFRKYIKMCDSDGDVYTKRFPVWHYGSAGVLEAEIMIIADTGEVRVNVFDYGTRYAYASWYCRKYGANSAVDGIDEKITKELNTLGVKINDE